MKRGGVISKRFLKSIRNIVGKENLLTNEVSRYSHSYDATTLSYMPDAVVIIKRLNDIDKIISLANEVGFYIIPRGSGTGMTGGALPTGGGLVLVLDRLNKHRFIFNHLPYIETEPGTLTSDIQNTAQLYHYFYPPDPASQEYSTIGGNVAEGAGGPHGLKYGTTRDYILYMDVVTGNGKNLTLTRGKDDNIIDLFCGSEGTLGIIKTIGLGVLPEPEEHSTVMFVFKSVSDAMRTVSSIIREGVVPSKLEFMDEYSIKAIKRYKDPGVGEGNSVVLLEADGYPKEVKKAVSEAEKIARSEGAVEVQKARTESEEDLLWEIRRNISPALSLFGPYKVNEDITVPPDMLVNTIEKIHHISERYGVFVACFGHIGDGNIHTNIMCDKRDKELMKRVWDAVSEIFRFVIDIGGTISGEHGIGITKQSYLRIEKSRVEIDVYKKIKLLFDPMGIMNPGKIFT
ncbi:MAG: hypothetical protein B6D57_00545 [Candidatus Coatesbacteria bacterium 4484_99]|uniref:FAD-binding PCMH-type domain-containing protein n=1 Tax=Candidatus Coatesbacteria bacterium 4484_99 TaxID=1970774 RepID=A0A1W9S4I4_9BACT|nr:MAG: hypothetical protein B6D57_00545 [Candidatus Coatesbacteria bacterium 4484_99]RLC41682.1 MAG: glycolate oxidase subunit GlcD [Candidatus Coatesbacteria bacterium]